jgi:hypothetical protein
MPVTQINFVAVFVTALSPFALGALWYSPFAFGRLWAESHGYDKEKMIEMQASAARAYVVSFLCYLFMALVLSILVALTGVATFVQGMWLGTLVWAGFAFTIGLTGNMFSDKPLSAFLIDTGYQLVYLNVMGGILAAWR